MQSQKLAELAVGTLCAYLQSYRNPMYLTWFYMRVCSEKYMLAGVATVPSEGSAVPKSG